MIVDENDLGDGTEGTEHAEYHAGVEIGGEIVR